MGSVLKFRDIGQNIQILVKNKQGRFYSDFNNLLKFLSKI